MQHEAPLQREILRLWGSHPRVRLWRANAGKAYIGTRPLQINIPGCPDLIGWIAPAGTFLGIECKADRGRLRPEQAAFRDRLEKDGGIYIEARSVEDVDRVLGRLV